MQNSDALLELFDIYDVYKTGHLSVSQLHDMYDKIRIGGISAAQVAASMEYVCGDPEYINKHELKDTLEEMDRRYYLIQDLQWEFALLDNEHKGSISVEKARFMFEVMFGNLFSFSKWRRFLQKRPLEDAPLTFAELEVDLCNRPQPGDWESDYFQGEKTRTFDVERKDQKRREERRKEPKVKPPLMQEVTMEKGIKEDIKRKKEIADESLRQSKLAEEEAARKAAEEEQLRRKREEEEKRKKEEEIAREEEEKKKKEEDKRKKEERKRLKEAEKKQKKKEERKAAKLMKADEERQLIDNLEEAIESRDEEKLKPAIKDYKDAHPQGSDVDDLLQEAERMLEMLKCSAVLKDAIAKRVIADLEAAIEKARKSGFDQSEAELANEVDAASDMILRLKRLEKLRSEVLELKQSTIAELRSYQKPIPVIHHVMIATYLLLGIPEKQTKKWQSVQVLLGKTGKEGLKRRISQCNVLDISLQTALRARNIVGEVDLEAIRDVSAGAATFFVWAEGMIEEVTNNNPSTLS